MSEEKVTDKPSEVVSEQTPETKQKPEFKTVGEALEYEIFEMYKQARDSGEFDVCISDRFNSLDFVSAFKDAINSYRNDVVICDRLYHKRFCTEGKRPTHTLPEAAVKLSDEFVEYTKVIDWDNKDVEYMEQVKNKIADYQEKLKAPEMQPQLTEVETWTYKNEILDNEYLVIPVKDIPDQALMNIASVVGRFVMTYFLSMRFVLDGNFQIKIFPVHSGDYVDMVAQIIIK